MIRIHLTAADLAYVRFAARPAPLQELNAALMMLMTPSRAPLLFGRWRGRAMRALPAAALPLRDLVPGRHAPAFLDSTASSLAEGFESLRASDPAWVAAQLEAAYSATRAAAGVAPPWVRALHRGAPEAWRPLVRAQRAAFDALLAPVWPLIQDQHHAEFAEYAAAVAEHGIGHALVTAVPGSRLHDGAWELAVADAATEREIRPDGRGVLLLPGFHWIGDPLVSDIPGRPVTVTYAAGPGLPPNPDAGTTEDALSDVLGRTRLRILMFTGEPMNTGDLARRLGLSAATVSVHTAALRAAGLVTSVREGKSVVHRRTALGGLLLGNWHLPRRRHHPDQHDRHHADGFGSGAGPQT